jgi:hypothetical protein
MISNKLWTFDKQNIHYSYDFVVFCCVGPLVLPKKDKIDPWHLAVLGTFALIIKNYIGSL